MKIVIKLLTSVILMMSQPAYSDKAKVCFYELADFGGESFCAEESESKPIYHYNDHFNDGIASISVPPGMIVTLYESGDFSGKEKTLKNDIDLPELESLGLYKKINSYRIASAACFYDEDKFQGNSTCLALNQKIDLYHDSQGIINSNRNSLLINNDSINSITVPQGMMATIYKNDNFNAPFFKLTEDTTANDLKSLGMVNNISSMKVSEDNDMSCDQQCVIIEDREIALPKAFGEYWHDTRLQNKQILLVFSSDGMGEDDNYEINFFDGPSIVMNERRIIFHDRNMINKFYFDRYEIIDNLSFIIQIKEDSVQTQYIQTLNNNLVDISPIISFEYENKEDNNTTIKISNYNILKPLILNKVILTADTGEKNWGKRDVSQISKIICAFIPFLNIYNYLTHGKCQQLDSIVFSAAEYFNNNTNGKTLHIAGNAKPIKKTSPAEVAPHTTDSVDNYMLLTYIDNTKHQQALNLPAVAKACMVSIYSLLNSRQVRQVRPYCIDWTLDIMTDFTLLFGHSLDTWNTVYFGHIIDTIIKTGSTGVAVENTEVETRLVNAIQEKIVEDDAENRFSHIKTAFDYAQLSYLTYISYYSIDDSPSVVELLPLGIYELLLETFIYRKTAPIIITQGEQVEQPELEFEVEILPTDSPEEAAKLSESEIQNAQAMRQRLRKTIHHWGQQYQDVHSEQSDNTEDSTRRKLLHAGHIVTGIIHRRLVIQRPGEIYVVVKLQGRIIAIVLADRFNSRDEVELVASATLPDYVLSPDREGTIRGAGTAAVRELAQYLQQQGVRTLFSEVISQPSARVKQKVGFSFKTEF